MKQLPFPELACGSNNLRAMASGKSPMMNPKVLRGHSNFVVDSNEWAQ